MLVNCTFFSKNPDLSMEEEERSNLEEKVETIICIISECLNSVCVINLKVLNGNIDDLSSPGRNEILGALLQDIMCTNRFIQS